MGGSIEARLPERGVKENVPKYWDNLAGELAHINKLSTINRGITVVMPFVKGDPYQPDPRRKNVIILDTLNDVFGVIELENQSHSMDTELWRATAIVRPDPYQAMLLYHSALLHWKNSDNIPGNLLTKLVAVTDRLIVEDRMYIDAQHRALKAVEDRWRLMKKE